VATRTPSIHHHPTGLRYRSGTCIPRGLRWELADYPGYVDMTHIGPTKTYVGHCPECNHQSFEQTSFTPAIRWLSAHIRGILGDGGCANRDERLSPSRDEGFFVEPDGAGGEIAVCTHQRCEWRTGSYRVGSMAASDQARKHIASYHFTNPTPSRKDSTMRTIEQVDRDIKAATARIEALYLEREKIEALPAEPIENLITFSISFTDPGTKYSYAARRARGLWFVTGREGGNGRTWHQMLEFMSQDAGVRAGKPIAFRAYKTKAGTVVKGGE
jgi:hypothetical protein